MLPIVLAMNGPVSEDFLMGALLAAVLIVFAIVGGAVAISWMIVQHKERMATIGMGMKPDQALPPQSPLREPQRHGSPTH